MKIQSLGRRVLCATFTLLAGMFAMPLHANGFASTAFLQSPSPAVDELFGDAVAADAGVLVVGAPSPGNGPGSVYVFRLVPPTSGGGPAWTLQATLHAPDGSANDLFGNGVSIQGGTLVAAAPNASGTNGRTGAAYVFVDDNGTWSLQAKLLPADATQPVGFGGGTNAVAISGNTIAVGASGAGSDATSSLPRGAVYVFSNDSGTWKQEAKIAEADPNVHELGFSVAIQDGTLLAGAFGTGTSAGAEVGAAFIYSRTNGAWMRQARLDSPLDFPGAFFGIGASLDGNTAVLGAPGINEVSVYAETNGVWGLQQVIEGPVLDPEGDFGTALHVSGDVLLVGAYEDWRLPDLTQTGTAFVYRRGGSTWTEQSDLRMAPGMNGIPLPAIAFQRFANLATIAKMGSTTTFVMGSPGLSDPATGRAALGGVYTATLN